MVLLMLACSGEPLDSSSVEPLSWASVEKFDEGMLCFRNADDEVSVDVILGDCLSSSCDRDFVGTCEYAVDADQLTLTSTFTWETAQGEVECTDDCGIPMATCELGALVGTYTVTLGTHTETAVFPPEESDCPYY